MFVCMHEISSLAIDFRSAMEGYARANIKAVEPHLPVVREFEQQEGAGAARRLLDDLGLEVVSSSNQLFLDESGPQRDQALEDLKWKLPLAESIGANKLVIPSVASGKHGIEYYDEACANLNEAADMAAPYNVTLMVEFTRISTLISNLRTARMLVQTIDHSHLGLMIDLYHFWSGTSKFEDLDLLEPGEIMHMHISDTPAAPPLEVAQLEDRVYPGEGIAPLAKIVSKLKSLGYNGPASLELFHPAIQQGNPFAVARKAISTISPLL